MPKLVKISPDQENAVAIWGFHDPMSVSDVAAAIKSIGINMKGAGHTIHIMSGTHGRCKGKVGVVARREEKFADEDRKLANPVTSDGHPIKLIVHDFNTNLPDAPDADTSVMKKLNSDIRSLVPNDKPQLHTFILAYCCSAGSL
jgi:hypothetical protein